MTPRATSLVAAAGWALVSAATFSLSSLAAKWLGVKLPTAELSWFRALAAMVAVVLIFRAARQWRAARSPGWHAIRAASGAFSLFCFMYAVVVLPLALAPLILLTRVLMIPFAARLMLGEAIERRVIIAGIIGFAGVLVVFWQSAALATEAGLLGAMAAVAAAVGTSISQTAVRRLTADNSEALIVAIYSLATIVLLAPLAAANWVTPPASAIPALIVLGAAAAAAQYAAAAAFRRAPAGFVAPWDFTAVPISAVLGFIFQGDVPTGRDLIGAVLIVAACWYVMTLRKASAETAPAAAE